VSPVRYELNLYVLFTRSSVFKGLILIRKKNEAVGDLLMCQTLRQFKKLLLMGINVFGLRRCDWWARNVWPVGWITRDPTYLPVGEFIFMYRNVFLLSTHEFMDAL
jgi:hypothetical protein